MMQGAGLAALKRSEEREARRGKIGTVEEFGMVGEVFFQDMGVGGGPDESFESDDDGKEVEDVIPVEAISSIGVTKKPEDDSDVEPSAMDSTLDSPSGAPPPDPASQGPPSPYATAYSDVLAELPPSSSHALPTAAPHSPLEWHTLLLDVITTHQESLSTLDASLSSAVSTLLLDGVALTQHELPPPRLTKAVAESGSQEVKMSWLCLVPTDSPISTVALSIVRRLCVTPDAALRAELLRTHHQHLTDPSPGFLSWLDECLRGCGRDMAALRSVLDSVLDSSDFPPPSSSSLASCLNKLLSSPEEMTLIPSNRDAVLTLSEVSAYKFLGAYINK